MKKVALIGNPNAGKTSVFNRLTGLNQQTGNFTGVTVEVKTAEITSNNEVLQITDFPGTYSLFPNSADERLVSDILLNPQHEVYPDVICYIAGAPHLERHLLLFSQIQDLGFPIILGVSMLDTVLETGISVDLKKLAQVLKVPVIGLNGRTGEGKEELLQAINQARTQQGKWLRNQDEQRLFLQNQAAQNFSQIRPQVDDVMQRYEKIRAKIETSIKINLPTRNSFTEKLDNILTHPIAGLACFIALLLIVFQAVFSWSEVPMNLIEEAFVITTVWFKSVLPAHPLTDLLTDGILAGLSGILVFIPQIAILSALIALLEESGYMARAVFLTDNIMRRFGLNGRSLVSLISGTACAIPAIIATRNISNQKERLITILVTPFMSCSARIPVFTLLTSVAIPAEAYWGIFNVRGLVMLALYLIGATTALVASKILSLIIKTNEKSMFMLELPIYQYPHWRNIVFTVYDKVHAFTVEAGKIILLVSIILWVLASFAPAEQERAAAEKVSSYIITNGITDENIIEQLTATATLEASYAAQLGKFIEPSIAPLGFDWKIGIALITSFAAREVFVATMATLYSIGNTDDTQKIAEKITSEINPRTGLPVFTLPVAFSLLTFYLFALQCASTLAVVKRETKKWKWAVLQFLFMTGWAYLASWIVYNVLK